MRLAELALLAYGALRDEVLRFPAGRPDLHLVYGPNAAGKSTARQAINDALFGFPERSPMGFAVDPRELRIGFEVERAGRTLAAIRRKGRKKTLLGPDGEQPADEALLEAWVGHIGRARFERAFALDDTQLRAGGEAIAEGGDDLAGLLFAASSGLARLSRALDRLEADADAAWGITRKASRRAQTAFDHFRAADEQLKAARLLTAAYRRKRDRLQQLEREREAVRGQRRALKAAAEQAALALRVLEPLGRFHRARTALGEVADVARLPEGAVVAIDGITARLAVNAQAVTTLEARAAELRREFDALPAHEPLLDLDEAIDAFGDRVAVVGEALARREVEVETRRRAEADARTVLADLGRCPAFTDARAVLAGLPNSRTIDQLDAVRHRRLTLAEQGSTLGGRLEAKRREAAQAAQAAALWPEPLDTAPLEAARAGLAAFRASGSDPLADATAADLAAHRLADALDRLAPWRGPADALALADLPAAVREAELREEVDALAIRADRLTARAHDLGHELDRVSSDLADLAAGFDVVDAATLETARQTRDRHWHAFRDRALAPNGAPDAALAQAVDAAIAAADYLADHRLAGAERTLRLANLEAQHRRLTAADEALRAEREAVGAALARVHADWAAVSRSTPMAGVPLEQAPGWREAAEAAIRTRREEREARAAAARSAERVQAVRTALGAALASLGVVVDEAWDLDRLDIEARTAAEAAARAAQARTRAIEALRLVEHERDLLESEASALERTWEADTAAWTTLLERAGLDPDLDLAAIAGMIEDLRRARAHLERALSAGDAIDATDAAATALAAEADRLAEAADFARGTPEAVKLALLGGRAQARRRQDRRAQLAAELERVDRDLASARDERAAIDAELAPFRVRVVTDEPAALRAAAVASDTRRAAETAVREAAESLERLAPGMAADRLVALVAGRDAVALRVEADDAARSLEDIENRLEGIQRELAEARQDLEGRAGAADAAEAESDRQQAAAAMARAIEDHLELVTTARLLRGALDGYRARHETPLLRRASLLFAELSLGEFERLAIDYTQATGTLVAVRPSGRPVDRSGLSAGTRDQLYLALRLAALELHFEQAPPLPLVVDDLFVQFSDDRAAAGFRVLERLARRTQVLVFTHHRHLIDLARATLGPNACTVQELPAEPARRETNGRQAANSA